MKVRLDDFGLDLIGNSAEAFAEHVQREIPGRAKVVKATGVKID